MRTIQYGTDNMGRVFSRCKDEIAVAVLDYEAIGQGGEGFMPGDFSGPIRYNLEKMPVHKFLEWDSLTWTKKVPVDIKNKHRAFWKMPLLKGRVPNECEKGPVTNG